MVIKTIDYKHFTDAGFDAKACSLAGISDINKPQSPTLPVYATASATPVYQHQHSSQEEIVSFTVDYLPFVGHSKLFEKGLLLVKAVADPKYQSAPCTVCEYNKDEINKAKTITVNNVIVQQVEFFLNRTNHNDPKASYLYMRFTLQGLLSK